MKTPITSEANIKTLKGAKVTVDVGEEAWQQLSSESFLASWDNLYRACPWSTVFQCRAFVITWYQAYQSKYKPILIKYEYEGKLIGLMTLAMPASSEKGHIVGAGQFEAEYHAWLTEASDEGQFIKAALSKLLQMFPGFAIHLRFIPPNAPLQWLGESYWKKRSVLYTVKRPLMDMNDPNLEKIFHKNEFRNKYSRLNKLGKLDFEHITSKDQFVAILDEVKVLFDFRRGAMFNKNLFLEEPRKVDFLLGLFEQNLLYVTVLKVNGQLFAFNAATTINDCVHLCGINVHIPFHARYYSPGFVNFILLSQQLAKEGVAVFDLTPGGDFYKDRLATRYDKVHELMVSNSRIYRLKRMLRKMVYEQLEKAGKWPMATELALRKQIYILKGRIRYTKKQGLIRTALEKFGSLIKPPTKQVYLLSADALPAGGSITISKNSLKDMLCFEAEGTWMTRWEFLENAMHRFEAGNDSYTYCEEGLLLACAWVKKTTTANILLLNEFYCHSKVKEQQENYIAAITAVIAASEQPHGELYAEVNANDSGIGRTLETIGFKKTDIKLD